MASDAWLLCFDELQVTNIVDAMLLRRLFLALFEKGVVMVTTSNRHPDGTLYRILIYPELYHNGIQRQAFLPAIALLKERCLVHNLNSGQDFRRRGKSII